jgi:hypothetical protein
VPKIDLTGKANGEAYIYALIRMFYQSQKEKSNWQSLEIEIENKSWIIYLRSWLNMRKKVDSYLGFAANPGIGFRLSYLSACHQAKKLKLLILSEDLSENTVKKLSKLSNENNIPFRIYEIRRTVKSYREPGER